MTRHDPSSPSARRTFPGSLLALAALGALLVAALATWQPPFPSSRSSGDDAPLDGAPRASAVTGAVVVVVQNRNDRYAEGSVPAGVTVFDDQFAAVANLDADLLAALRRAATAAADDGLRLEVNSGWRSAAHQERLLEKAIAERGSAEEAARWVATPETSPHVSGDAVDIGGAGAGWLAVHGAGHGLCQVYDNEPWHFELREYAATDGCPATYADPSRDPRMQQ
ncbi:D-alanyl-D-alanine carboxypeptidase family protein [Nocardioides cavernaquae]|uniref:Peptidase M15 n=1 Tax=Nocardioides cavernaquae TaxID=2321396 RepID=A0A3A5HCC7_9ACTN|nr:D-alanyl-D-alanine carboxypeptidase family protein [Nocardioides cavernaquae]RJS45704.1 peptidase M15 [Nocardioides cavernaquae]